MNNNQKVIAIDGSSGSGKSTLARRLSEVLGLLYVDTGAMFRAMGLACHRRGMAFEDGAPMEQFLAQVRFHYCPRPGVLVEVDGEDYSAAIRQHQVSEWASRISQVSMIRHYLLEYQRSLPGASICVMEGRDIGTVVFPFAFCKIFMVASLEVRAQRRYQQLEKQGQKNLHVTQILKDLEKRDEQDEGRSLAPLIRAPDATLIDTSELEGQETLKRAVEVVREKARQCGLPLPQGPKSGEEK